MSNNNLTNSSEQFPPENADMLMEALFSHSKRLIVSGLDKYNVDTLIRGTKQELRAYAQWQLDEGIIDVNQIVAALIELEGWGRQQVYLYRWNGGVYLQNQWLNRKWVENRFRAAEMSYVYNSTRPVRENDDSTLFSITYPENVDRIRFVWVQNRSTLRRVEEQDPEPSQIELSPDGTSWQRRILRAYLETRVRDVTSFEWDIAAGEAMLMIRKFKETDYVAVRDAIEAELADILPTYDFRPVRMSKLINDLDDIEDVIRPRVDYRTLTNPNIRMTFAGGSTDDVLSDQKIQEIRQEHRGDLNGYGGFSKWKIGRKKWVGIDLYARKEHDHRIGIRSEELEKDVRRVLQRIRTHC